MTVRYRINNRLRFTLAVVIAIILLTTAANLILGLSTADSATVQDYTELKVHTGDTLWSIAGTYMSDNSDIRKAVYDLCRINDIQADELYAGMTILIPA